MTAKQQRCSECDALTGRCEDDSIYVDDSGDPLCEDCRDTYPICDVCGSHVRHIVYVKTEPDDGIQVCEGCRT